MGLTSHCLFCVEQITPYNVESDKSQDSQVDTTHIPNFQQLCSYLKLSLSDGGSNSRKSFEGLTCEKFLCIWCFELVDELSKLHRQLNEVQRKVYETEKKIREVIVRPNAFPNSQERWKKLEGNVGETGESTLEKIEALAFVELFQKLVKSGNDAFHNTTTFEVETNLELQEVMGNGDCPGSNFIKTEPLPEIIQLGHQEDCYVIEETVEKSICEDGVCNVSGLKTKVRDKCKEMPSKPAETLTRTRRTYTRRCKQKVCNAPINIVSGKSKKSAHIRNNKLQRYKCPECDLTFISTWRVGVHRKQCHSKNLSAFKRIIQTIPTLHIASKSPGVRNRCQVRVCTICGVHIKEYSKTKLLKYIDHMLSHEEGAISDESGPYSCTQCAEKFILKINLDLHKACIHDARQIVIKCDYCTQLRIFGTKDELVEHLKIHGDAVHSCKHCPLSFITLERLLKHMERHKECKKLLCPECDTGICSSITEIHRHCQQFHPHLKETHPCGLCDKSFLTIGYLRQHKQLAHNIGRNSNTCLGESENLVCLQCNKSYSSKMSLDQHVYYMHGEGKRYSCDQCGKRFISPGILREHIKRDHENFRHACSYCNKSFTDRHYLKSHMRIHTKEGLLTCHVCAKQCPSTGQLNVHLRSHHTPRRPEDKRVCDECGKEFLDQARLYRHKINVHKEPQECSVCGIRVKRADHMRSHMRTHTGERPFICPVCKKGFTRKDIMRVHVKGVHGIELAEAEKKTLDLHRS